MRSQEAISILQHLARRHIAVLSKNDLAKAFPAEHPKTFEKSLQRLVSAGLLERATKGVYINSFVGSSTPYLIEHIAMAMRRGEWSYVSLESALAEYGLISQIPIDRLTVMTTGAKGTYVTPYGTIEFTKTKRSLSDIIDSTRAMRSRPLLVATESAAVRDLKRVGRNIDLLSGSLY